VDSFFFLSVLFVSVGFQSHKRERAIKVLI